MAEPTNNRFTPYLAQGLSFPLYDLNPEKVHSDGSSGPQSGQKRGTCANYAANILRDRAGKNPPARYLHARNIEICCSSYRKQFTHLPTSEETIKLVTVPMKNLLGEFFNHSPIQIKSNLEKFTKLHPILIADFDPPYHCHLKINSYDLIKSYSEQNEFGNFNDFAVNFYYKKKY